MTVWDRIWRASQVVFGLSLLALLTTGLVACDRSKPVAAEGRFEVSGRALVTPSGKGGEDVSRTRPLRRGDTVELIEGTGRVVLADGASLEMRPRTTVLFDNGPELRSGDLLVLAPGGPVRLRAAGAEVSASGAARFIARLSLSAGSYTGKLTVRSGGRNLDVPALRQASLPAEGLLPAEPSPITLDRADDWDRRFLGPVIASLDALESRARGFTTPDASVGFFRRLIPALDSEPAYQQETVQRLGGAGEILVGSTIALAGRKATFGERLNSIIEFRADGAPWALVAFDQQADIVKVTGDVDKAIDRAANEDASSQALAPVTPPPSSGETAAPAPTTPSVTSPSAQPPRQQTPPSANRTSRPPTSQPPSASQPPEEPDPILGRLLDTVAGLVDGLLGGD